ncbi:YgiQ family radical SAM protein [Gehongia tenuis]|uniref:YgiQ family radical SAM protein n=1 Tax=Gehongia tenuis TaxID=2763655 RepID=A0A926HQ67_9FIRM|nr:YgiQ family radical SAM protein [Gehongia tenuis]MBC8530931.1 YgiQ family radical SAM protein [Gehongia tenuis]
MQFLPVNRQDLEARGIDQPDFVMVSGDAYVDHPSFGPVIIARWLEHHGYSVGIIPQPDWRSTADIEKLGRPRLAFLVCAGNVDSMVNHYTALKRRRHDDAYSPGGRSGMRPDRATLVYCNLIRQAFEGVPIIIGGIEASLRRLAHYDYWDDRVRRSILLDSRADLLIYGMGERPSVEIADALSAGIPVSEITYVNGTCFKASNLEDVVDFVEIPSFEAAARDKKSYARAFMVQQENQNAMNGKRLAQRHGPGYVVQNPPAQPLDQETLDAVYDLPYMRAAHPMYEEPIPAFSEVAFSITSNRGCFGSCSFCALGFHQGRIIQARSHESILREAELLTRQQDFKGYIHDVGGPTADFRFPACDDQLERGPCPGRQCLFPRPCGKLRVDHGDYLALLRKLRRVPGVKKVFVRSGLRYDYIVLDKDPTFLKELVAHHVSGQLKVAPEHVSERVLRLMGKPGHDVYSAFKRRYSQANRELHKKQYLVPYYISSHPGSTLEDAVQLAETIRNEGVVPEQVQDFYPTPGTLSTCMYFTGMDPRTGRPVHVPKGREKELQRALLQYSHPKNRAMVVEALQLCGREDLIGFDKKCLVRPLEGRPANRGHGKGGTGRNGPRPAPKGRRKR